jgi:hypothetical protein
MRRKGTCDYWLSGTGHLRSRIKGDPDVIGDVRLHGHGPTIFGPSVAHRRFGQLAPESRRAGILFLEGDLPNAGVPIQHRKRGTAADATASHSANDEEAGHQSARFVRTADQSKADGTGLIAKQIRATVGLGKEHGVAIIVTKSSAFIGTSESKLREIVDVELQQVLYDWSRFCGHCLEFD